MLYLLCLRFMVRGVLLRQQKRLQERIPGMTVVRSTSILGHNAVADCSLPNPLKKIRDEGKMFVADCKLLPVLDLKAPLCHYAFFIMSVGS